MTSEWLGDNQNGVEFRYEDDGTIDEVVVYVDGKCVVHSEKLNDNAYWMGITTKAGHASVNFQSRGAVDCNGELNV